MYVLLDTQVEVSGRRIVSTADRICADAVVVLMCDSIQQRTGIGLNDATLAEWCRTSSPLIIKRCLLREWI